MFQVVSALSGEHIVTWSTDQVYSRDADDLKIALEPIVGVPRFRQKLFLEDGISEVECEGEDEYLSLTPQRLQLVLLKFQTPDAESEGRLIEACRSGDAEFLTDRLSEPQDPNVSFQFSDSLRGSSALHLAVNWICIKRLLEADADVNKTNATGETPLYVAISNGHKFRAQMLLDAGADPNTATEAGETQLFLAAQNGHVNVARYLVRVRGDVNKARKDGMTPLLIAVQRDHGEMFSFLIQYDKVNYRQHPLVGGVLRRPGP